MNKITLFMWLLVFALSGIQQGSATPCDRDDSYEKNGVKVTTRRHVSRPHGKKIVRCNDTVDEVVGKITALKISPDTKKQMGKAETSNWWRRKKDPSSSTSPALSADEKPSLPSSVHTKTARESQIREPRQSGEYLPARPAFRAAGEQMNKEENPNHLHQKIQINHVYIASQRAPVSEVPRSSHPDLSLIEQLELSSHQGSSQAKLALIVKELKRTMDIWYSLSASITVMDKDQCEVMTIEEAKNLHAITSKVLCRIGYADSGHQDTKPSKWSVLSLSAFVRRLAEEMMHDASFANRSHIHDCAEWWKGTHKGIFYCTQRLKALDKNMVHPENQLFFHYYPQYYLHLMKAKNQYGADLESAVVTMFKLTLLLMGNLGLSEDDIVSRLKTYELS